MLELQSTELLFKLIKALVKIEKYHSLSSTHKNTNYFHYKLDIHSVPSRKICWIEVSFLP